MIDIVNFCNLFTFIVWLFEFNAPSLLALKCVDLKKKKTKR